MAKTQYLIYLQKQKALEEEYKHILAEPEETKEEEGKTKEGGGKIKTMTLETMDVPKRKIK